MLKKIVLMNIVFSVSSMLFSMEDNNKALLAAAFNGDYKQCNELLCEQDAQVNCSDSNGNTPLHLAANRSVIQVLYIYQPDINQKNKYKETPLLYHLHEKQSHENNELQENRYQKIDTLLSFGANPNDKIETTGRTALHIACSHKQENIVRLLLEKGANPTICSRSGLLPIELLTTLGSSKNIINLFSPYGYTVFCKSSDKSDDLHELLTNNAAYLKELTDAYSIGGEIKNLLYHLFVTLQEQEDLDETKKQQSVIKVGRPGIICRYPSYFLLEGLFGAHAMAYAKKILKTKIIGDHLLEIDIQQGRNAALEEMKQPIYIPHNNKDLFVSTPEENKEYFVYMLKSYKHWNTQWQQYILLAFLSNITSQK